MAKERRSEAIWVETRERWQINVQRDGKRKTFTSSTPGRRGKHDAEEKADEWLDAGQPEDMRFDAAWAVFLSHVKSTTGTANHYDHESIGRVWLLPSLSKKKISRIRLADMQAIINSAADAGRSYRTCCNIRSKLSSFYIYAGNQKWQIDTSLPGKIKIPSKAHKGKKKVVQPNQLKILFSHDTEMCRNKERPCFFIHAFRFFVIGGIRSGELCGFKRSDFTGSALIINRSINRHKEVRQGKNDNARRTIPLTTHAIKVLKDQEAMLKHLGIQSEWLFPDQEGNCPADSAQFVRIPALWHL